MAIHVIKHSLTFTTKAPLHARYPLLIINFDGTIRIMPQPYSPLFHCPSEIADCRQRARRRLVVGQVPAMWRTGPCTRSLPGHKLAQAGAAPHAHSNVLRHGRHQHAQPRHPHYTYVVFHVRIPPINLFQKVPHYGISQRWGGG